MESNNFNLISLEYEDGLTRLVTREEYDQIILSDQILINNIYSGTKKVVAISLLSLSIPLSSMARVPQGYGGYGSRLRSANNESQTVTITLSKNQLKEGKQEKKELFTNNFNTKLVRKNNRTIREKSSNFSEKYSLFLTQCIIDNVNSTKLLENSSQYSKSSQLVNSVIKQNYERIAPKTKTMNMTMTNSQTNSQVSSSSFLPVINNNITDLTKDLLALKNLQGLNLNGFKFTNQDEAILLLSSFSSLLIFINLVVKKKETLNLPPLKNSLKIKITRLRGGNLKELQDLIIDNLPIPGIRIIRRVVGWTGKMFKKNKSPQDQGKDQKEFGKDQKDKTALDWAQEKLEEMLGKPKVQVPEQVSPQRFLMSLFTSNPALAVAVLALSVYFYPKDPNGGPKNPIEVLGFQPQKEKTLLERIFKKTKDTSYYFITHPYYILLAFILVFYRKKIYEIVTSETRRKDITEEAFNVIRQQANYIQGVGTQAMDYVFNTTSVFSGLLEKYRLKDEARFDKSESTIDKMNQKLDDEKDLSHKKDMALTRSAATIEQCSNLYNQQYTQLEKCYGKLENVKQSFQKVTTSYPTLGTAADGSLYLPDPKDVNRQNKAIGEFGVVLGNLPGNVELPAKAIFKTDPIPQPQDKDNKKKIISRIIDGIINELKEFFTIPQYSKEEIDKLNGTNIQSSGIFFRRI